MSMVLRVDNICKAFGKNIVLKNLSLELDSPYLCGIVGENGSGKTTLLKIIIGEWRPNQGKVSIRGRFGYCPQEILLFPQLTVNEHIRYFGQAYGMQRKAILDRSEFLLDIFSFGQYRNMKVAGLSGGTRQKLSLTLALLHQPRLLILDEPYSGFDWDTYQKFWHLAGRLRSEGCTILIVTHMIADQRPFDRIFNLESGHLS